MEYYNKIYKLYDGDKNLAGYFFPRYDLVEETEIRTKQSGENQGDNEDKIIELMNKSHIKVQGGQLLLPMIKLDLLDNEEGLALDYAMRCTGSKSPAYESMEGLVRNKSNGIRYSEYCHIYCKRGQKHALNCSWY